MSHWTDRKSNNGYGYGQYTALDVLQAKKSREKRSIRSNYAKKKKVPGWSTGRVGTLNGTLCLDASCEYTWASKPKS